MDTTAYTTTTTADGNVFALLFGGFLIFTMIGLVAYVLTALGIGQYFKKAGKPAWAGFVPFYNYWIMTEIAGIERYWFWLTLVCLLSFIPPVGALAGIVTLVAYIYITVHFLRKYSKDTGDAVLAILFSYVYYPLTGFSKDLHYSGVTTPKVADVSTPPSAPTPPTPPPASV